MYMKTATRPSNPAQCIARSVDQRSTAANKPTTRLSMYCKGSCTYYVITFGGPKSPPPPCNIVIIWAYPPLCNTVIISPYPPSVKL